MKAMLLLAVVFSGCGAGTDTVTACTLRWVGQGKWGMTYDLVKETEVGGQATCSVTESRKGFAPITVEGAQTAPYVCEIAPSSYARFELRHGLATIHEGEYHGSHVLGWMDCSVVPKGDAL